MIKQGIYQYLKGATIFIYEDFSKETLTITKKLWKKVLAYRKQENIYLQHRRVTCKDRLKEQFLFLLYF